MILLTVKMNVARGKRTELSQALTSLMARTRRREGCIRSDSYRQTEDGDGFCVILEWKTRRALDRYAHSDDLAVLLGAINALTRCSELSYFVVSARGTLEAAFPLGPLKGVIGTPQAHKRPRVSTARKKKGA